MKIFDFSPKQNDPDTLELIYQAIEENNIILLGIADQLDKLNKTMAELNRSRS